VSDKATWTRGAVGTFQWSEEERERIRTKIVPVLVCDEPTACEAVRRFLAFVNRHRQNEIAMKAIPTILAGLEVNWCQDKKGRSKKLTAFVKTLRSLDWLYIAAGHSYGLNGEKGRARRYAVGLSVADKFVAGAVRRECELLPTPAAPPLGGLLSYLVGNPTDKLITPSESDTFEDCVEWEHTVNGQPTSVLCAA
jgi:hypothetical protein